MSASTFRSSAKLFDEMDFQRAVQAYLWALPYVSLGQFQSEQRDNFGAQNLDYVDYIDLKDRLGILTANATTPYSMAFPNLVLTGPLVIEIPAGPTAGGVTDFWQRPLTDTGALGPEKAQGGKFLILGPGDPDMRPDGYHVFRSPTSNFWSGNRSLDADPAKAKALLGKVRIYPFSQRENPKDVSRHLGFEGRKWAGQQPGGLAYWALLSRLVNEEPAIERDRITLATLAPLGVEKGKPFAPDERQKRNRRRVDGPRQRLRQALRGRRDLAGQGLGICAPHAEDGPGSAEHTQLTSARRGSTRRSAWLKP